MQIPEELSIKTASTKGNRTLTILIPFPNSLHKSIGNPGSLCVTRDITQVNYREHMRRSLGLKICWKMEIKIDETYHVASFCCP